MFFFSPKSDFEKEGFKFSKFSKKKIFVSYCHKNKTVVGDIIDNLRSYGLDFWIDEEQIDVGDRLMERIDKGMREADIPIVFLSNATKESMYAKHELQTFFSQIIYQTGDRKNWYIVKLDDVNPNDILLGLGDFKYFDVETNEINELVDSLKRKLK
ncbi:toll/interleukin-1 receptor domain-containing protein [Enterococcus sp. BWR-S5]|nr:toll/interleukin-1 receptor domain-containing protein [Enterococcus sp. BWR-S5]MBL1226498.1 toll/interleukin-1 receptor domain-containing protein [Enterococcus sp. BWR-S5]